MAILKKGVIPLPPAIAIISFGSLKSRIIVAAGSGGIDSYLGDYGYAGALNGSNSIMTYNFVSGNHLDSPLFAGGATQTKGGQCKSNDDNCIPGRFGVSTGKKSTDHGSFGGGGYYSGASYETPDHMGNGGGGSSFISGYPGCDAINKSSTGFDNIIHTGQSRHFSGHVFYDMTMKSGNDTKYTSNGKVIITILSMMFTPVKIIRIKIPTIFLTFFIS